uniref:ABC-type xenobiotic transporter n=1 Tax=Strigamia maritima TaxID=126957 RepID=T1ILP6_STRMM
MGFNRPLQEVIGAVRTVLQFGGEQVEVNRFTNRLYVSRKINIKQGVLNGLNFSLVLPIMQCSIVIGVWYGIKLMLYADDLESQYNIVFMILMSGIFVRQAAYLTVVFNVGFSAASDIINVIDKKQDIDNGISTVKILHKLSGNINFNKVCFQFQSTDEKAVLKGLSLNVKAGEIVALVGPSGGGSPPYYKGEISIDGIPLKEMNIGWFRTKIGIVNQEPHLFNTTIKENIKYGKENASEEEIIAVAKAVDAHNFILKLPQQYDTVVGEQGSLLSVGQKQRIAIARALIKNPAILLLDEATSALDNESETKILDFLTKADCGRTVITIAHRLSTVRTVDRIIGIKDGRVVEQGTPHELIEAKGLYYQLLQVLEEKEILRQEVGWFDEPAHNIGNLCSLMMIDAENVKKINSLLINNMWEVIIAFSSIPSFGKACTSAIRLVELFDRKPLNDSSDSAGIQLSTAIRPKIEFCDVGFSYPTTPTDKILNHFNLVIDRGEVVAFVGASGCGKTTCVQLLQRFYDPIDGKVTVNGYDVRSFNISFLRSLIGYVPQEPVLFSRSIGENVAYGNNERKVEIYEIIEAAKTANIHEFITSLQQGYDTLIGARGVELSGGQKQRVAIARALVKKSKILLLDEATSALDNDSEKAVQQSLGKVMKDRTCIIVAHRLSTIQNADKIVVFSQGKIVEIGSPQHHIKNKIKILLIMKMKVQNQQWTSLRSWVVSKKKKWKLQLENSNQSLLLHQIEKLMNELILMSNENL